MKKLTKKLITMVLAMTMLMGLTLTANAKTKSSPQPQYVAAFVAEHVVVDGISCGYPQNERFYMLMTDEAPQAGTTIKIIGIPKGSGVWAYGSYRSECDFEVDTYKKIGNYTMKNGECTFTIFPGCTGPLMQFSLEVCNDEWTTANAWQDCGLDWENGILPEEYDLIHFVKIPVNQVPGYENYGQPATQVTQDKTQEELLAQYYAALAKQQAKKAKK